MNSNFMKNTLRALGIIIVIILFAFILNIIFAINGNPIYINTATRHILTYAKYTRNLDAYNHEKVQYSFKNNLYYIKFQNKNIKDDHYNIYYNSISNEIDDSEYTNNVISRKNTINRLTQEYKNKINTIFINNLSTHDFKQINMMEIKLNEDKIKKMPLDINVEYIKNEPIDLTLYISSNNTENFNLELEMRILNRILYEHNININTYTFIFNKLINSKTIENITPKEIISPTFDIFIYNKDKKGNNLTYENNNKVYDT